VAIYLVPLMVGTRGIAFPRLTAFSYWIYVAGGILLWVAFALNIGPDAGWFAYTPLSGPQYSPGKTRRHVGADDHVHGAVRPRCRDQYHRHHSQATRTRMSLNRMPLFVWSMLVMSLMILFAMPAVMLASTFLLMDRLVARISTTRLKARCVALAAPVLVLRPSRGLYHLHSRAGESLSSVVKYVLRAAPSLPIR